MDTDGLRSKGKYHVAEASEQEKERKDSAGCHPPFKQQNNQPVTTRRQNGKGEKEEKKQALPPFGRRPGAWFSPAAVGSSHYRHHN